MFIYMTNGYEFEDTEAFGKAWKQAVAMAKENHTAILRKVVRKDEIEFQFYAGGCFLDERFYSPEKIKIF